MTHIALVATLTTVAPGIVRAQSSPNADTALANAVSRARGLIDGGDGTAARAVLDSLVRVQDAGSDALAEALYWRAVLAENASDAERDWQRLVIETALSPRVPDALLWLGELEIVRGHGALARNHFQRLLRDFPDAAQRPRAELWVARSYFDEGDRTVGCARANALRGRLAEGELKLQADDLMARCASLDVKVVTAATIPDVSLLDSVVPRPSATAARPPASKTGRYTVQLAAFGTRREAERAVTRLAKAGVSSRIAGTRKPFRVQTGRYTTRAEATKALAALKKRGQKGFVAEVPR